MPRRPEHVKGMLVARMAAVLVAGVWSCTAHPQERVNLEAEIHGDSGQLVIYWQQPIQYIVDRSGPYLFVRFSRPFRGDTTSAQRTLSSHLSELYFAGQGRVLVMRARGKPDFRHFAVANAVVLAWTDTRRPPPSEARRADLGLPKAPQRTNAHRLGPRPTAPATSALPTLSPESGSPPRSAPWEARPRKTPTPQNKVRPDEEAPAEVNRLPNQKSAKARPPGKGKESDEAKPSPVEKTPGEANPPDERPPRAEAEPSPDEKKPEEEKPRAEHKSADEGKPSESQETKPSEEGMVPQVKEPLEEDEPAPPRTIGWTFIVSSAKHETHIMFDWPAPTATAVFRYAGRIWIIFNRPATLGDLVAFQTQLGPGVERLTSIEHATFTILVARVKADVRARVQQQANSWSIFLKSGGDAEPEQTAKLGVRRGTAEQATISLPGAVSPLRLAHPDVGGTLHIIPSRSTIAVAVDWRFDTFQLVPSVQGAVIVELADGVVIAIDAETVIIRRDSGPMLSPD